MKISVIVPVYNVEQYLQRCVTSIQNQTLKDLEIILVDDGSTDTSGNLCDEIAETDERIKVIHKKNGGLSSARNEGLKYASSELIGFVDSDDWVSEDMYEYLYKLQKRTMADIVSCDYTLISDYKNIIDNSDNIKEFTWTKDEALENYLKVGIEKNKNDFSAWSKLYKKELFNYVLFPEGLYFEDIPTNFKMISHCEKYVKSTKRCYFYFQNSTSITRNVYKKKHEDLLVIAKDLRDYQTDNTKIKRLTEIFTEKSYFSLLSKIVKFGTDSDISYDHIKNDLLKPYRRHIFLLCKVRLPLKKRIASIVIYLFFELLYHIKY